MAESPGVVAVAGGKDLCVRYGTQVVLDNATLSVHEGDRIGLVGRNGTGKSTFLRIAAGETAPDSGEFTTRRDLVTGYLPQVFDLDGAATVLDNVLAGAARVREMVARYEAAPDAPGAEALLDAIEAADGWNLESRALALLNHLHAPDPGRLVEPLSGGEKRRVALCRALAARPDFLILDEPTNHLDTGAIEWLETFLARYSGTCLFVTHDRYFLDNIATRIVELARGGFVSYQGNYTDYLLARAERAATEAQTEHKRQRFLARELAWVRRSPSARRTKSKDRIDRYYEEAGKEAPEEEIDVELVIPPPPKLANRVIDVESVSKALGGKPLFSDLSFKLEAGQRLGIVGRNGLGKSTLVKVMLGLLEPDSGRVETGTRTEVNFVDQGRLELDDEKSVFEEVGEGTETVRLGEQTIGLRAYLRRYLFTEERINTKIGLLSGGERSRVLLAKILKRGGNVIVLDEPTNDLDLATLRLLEEALLGFGGCAVVVSHDRYFLNRVCTGILAFEGEGRVAYQVGNYDYYLEKRDRRAAATAAARAGKPKPKTKEAAVAPRKLTYKEGMELDAMEETITAAEAALADLDALFADPDFYAKHGDDWQELEAAQTAAREEVARLYARWEELTSVQSAYDDHRAAARGGR